VRHRGAQLGSPTEACELSGDDGLGAGLALEVGKAREFVCAGDTALTSGNPLAYGDKIVSGSIECTSSPDGITWWDFVYGGEFSISRQAYHLA